MDFDEWSMGGGKHFTELAGWLGFKDCVYGNVRHDDRDGHKFVMDLGPDCRLEA